MEREVLSEVFERARTRSEKMLPEEMARERGATMSGILRRLLRDAPKSAGPERATQSRESRCMMQTESRRSPGAVGGGQQSDGSTGQNRAQTAPLRTADVSSAIVTNCYAGRIIFPRRVFEGHSHAITAELNRAACSTSAPCLAPAAVPTERGVDAHVHVPVQYSSREFLELELLAAGVAVAGESAQRQPLSAESLRFGWNCFFANSGKHNLSLSVRLVDGESAVTLGVVPLPILVAKIGRFTGRQIWIFQTVAMALAKMVTVAEAVIDLAHRLGHW